MTTAQLKSMPELAGKVALVTGAASGIGAAVAERFVAAGALVVAADVDLVGARAVSQRLGPDVSAVEVDVSDPASVIACFESVVVEHESLDVVVHAAGVDDPLAKHNLAVALEQAEPTLLTTEVSDLAWHRLVAVNLEGTFHVLRECLRHMCRRGTGSVVVVGSSAAIDAPSGIAHYVATKAGVHGLCEAVAKEAIRFGVRVNVVAPGPTRTGMTERTPPALRDVMSEQGRLRYLEPAEIAECVLFLGSERSSAVAGEVLLANGGRFTR